MPIRVACPTCGRERHEPDRAVGGLLRCPYCQTRHRLHPSGLHSDDLLVIDGTEPATSPATPSADLPMLIPVARPRPARPRRVPDRHRRLATAAGVVAALVALVAFGWYQFSGPEPGSGGASYARAVAAAVHRGLPADSRPAPPAPANAAPPDRAAPAGDRPELAREAQAAAGSIRPGEAARGAVLSTADIVERCEPSIALIEGPFSHGTGFLVGPKLLATAAHVVDGEPIGALSIRFPSAPEGRRGPFPATLLYEDTARDLAFLAVDAPLPALTIAPTYQYRKGDDVTIIGNPGLDDDDHTILENAVTRGVMSTRTAIEGRPFYQLSIAVNPGNSGGPVLDPGGQVIGVCTMKTTKQEALAFSVPIEDLHDALGRLARQSPAETAALQSRHRTLAVFQGLGSLGALYGLGLELHVARRLIPDDKDLPEKVDRLDKVLQRVSAQALDGLLDESDRLAQDPSAPAEPRARLSELRARTLELRSTYVGLRGSIALDRVQALKAQFRRLVESLQSSLSAELPEGILSALEDHIQSEPAGGTFAVQVVPTPGRSLHDRMMERHRRFFGGRFGPGFPATPPGFGPGGFGP